MRKLARVTTVDGFAPIEGADRIVAAHVGGWTVITPKAAQTDDKDALFVHRFVYAVPAGLIDRPPVGTDQRSGLVWVHPNGRVEWKRKCKINHSPEALPQLLTFNIAWRAAKGEARSF